MHRFWLLAFLLSLPLSLVSCAGATGLQGGPPQAADGVLDLRGWDFAQDGPVRLDGEWAFSWQQLLSASAGADGLTSSDALATLPGTWRGMTVDGQRLPGEGYATYQLTVLLDPAAASGLLAVEMPLLVLTAHRLYVNGHLLGSAGQVGADTQTASPGINAYVAPFLPNSDRLDIALQIANFQGARGGVIDSIRLGSYKQLSHRREQALGLDMFIAGAILIMGLYHLALFGVRRREKSLLYFGAYCVVIAGVVLVSAPSLLSSFRESLDWRMYVLMRQALPLPAILSLILFVHSLYAAETHRWAVPLAVATVLVLAALLLLVPTTVLTALVPLVAAIVATSTLYSLGVVALAAWRKRGDATVVLLGFLPLVGAALNDGLYYLGRLQTRPLIHEGLLLFALVQTYLLARRFGHAFVRIERLSQDLQERNRSLVQAQSDLRRSETRYRSIFEDSRDVIFLADLAGRIEGINPACLDLLGYGPEEMQTRKVQEFLVDPDAYADLQAALAADGSVADFPVQVRRADGRERTCQLTASLRRDATGAAIGVQGILHDMTAYRQAEAERQRAGALQRLNQGLEQRLAERTADLSDASAALQEEITRRQMHQQEKDRLLELAQQQSAHLNNLSAWLAEMQQNSRPASAASGTPDEMEQKLTTIRQNLGLLQNAAIVEQDPALLLQIADTIRLLAEMEVYVEQVSAAQESSSPPDPMGDSPLLQLSSRERQVLKLMAEGTSNPEIADLLTVRLNTVHTYLKRIRTKLDIQDTPGLINFAREHGLIE